MSTLPEPEDESGETWAVWLDLWAQSVRHRGVAQGPAGVRRALARDDPLDRARRVRRPASSARSTSRTSRWACRRCSTASPSRSPLSDPVVDAERAFAHLDAVLHRASSASNGPPSQERERRLSPAVRRVARAGRGRNLSRINHPKTRSLVRKGRSPVPPGQVQLVGLTKRFADVVAVDDLSLEIRAGEFFSLLGPSGCGKTTTLRLVAGFEEPTAGHIMLDGVDVAKLPPNKRNVNTVFQSYALFPFLDVAGNVAFGLQVPVPRQDGDPKKRSARCSIWYSSLATRSAGSTSFPEASSSASRSRGRWS